MMDREYVFNREVAAALRRLCGSLAGKKIAAALSGGPDSVCLLHSLVSLSKSLGFEVEAVHVNHLIRGAEADRDENFCRALCEKSGVKLTVLREDIPAAAKRQGKSIELCAREYRYAAFQKLSRERGINFTATAHNANDNAETVLHNILRGSGLDGLCGIPERRGCIIRPLLGKTRAEILACLKAMGADYVEDSTNADNRYTRNYLRNVLLPCASEVNPDAVGALNRLAKAVSADAAYLNALVRQSLSGEKAARLDTLPKALRLRAVRALCLKHCGFVPECSHAEAICSGLVSGGEKKYGLPRSHTAVTHGGFLEFERSGSEAPRLESAPLAEGENLFAGGSVKVELSYGKYEKTAEPPEKPAFSVSLNRSAAAGGLYVRGRRSGDSVVVRKMNRSVKKCFIDRKVPASMRDRVPVICDGEGIVYVPFVGAADRAYAKNGGETCNIKVTIERVGRQ